MSNSSSDEDDVFNYVGLASDDEEDDELTKNIRIFTNEDFLVAAQVLEAFVDREKQVDFFKPSFVIDELPPEERKVKGRLRASFNKAIKRKKNIVTLFIALQKKNETIFIFVVLANRSFNSLAKNY